MSASAISDLGRLVPGFEFLQGLAKNAGQALPGIGQWIAPTLNPEDLEKRIEELRTVQFWLEQNSKMLGATIQALEVQRMTLSTLRTMNVPVTMLRDSLQASPSRPAADKPGATSASARASKSTRSTGKDGAAKSDASAPVDPMQWWGALTQQFTALAASAMKDAITEGATEGAKTLASSIVKQGFDAAEQTLKAGVAAGMAPVKKATSMAGAMARSAATAAAKPRKRPAPRSRRAKGGSTNRT